MLVGEVVIHDLHKAPCIIYKLLIWGMEVGFVSNPYVHLAHRLKKAFQKILTTFQNL